MATSKENTSYPWQPQSTKTAKRAIGDLGVGLMNSLKTSRGIHAETLITVTGALTGFAAQNAALNHFVSPLPSASQPRSFAVAHAVSGGKFLFGDAINAFLFPESGSVLPVASLIAGAAMRAGAKEADLPNVGEIAAYVASVVGSDSEFGRLRMRSSVEPQIQPVAALKMFWPKARDVLLRPPVRPLVRVKELPLLEIHWPIVLSLVGSQYITMTKQVLNPAVGASLFMESAVMTSKIDPELVEPGKWRIEIGNTPPSITRLRS